jgi:TonB-linked SusC/RagA family outer membrane protein
MKIICLTGFPNRETKKKWGRIMRLTLFLMVGFLLTASANSYSQNTRMTIKLKNGTVTELMKYVEDNSEFVFLYKNEDLDLKKKVTVELENATIQQVLDAGFKGQNVGWEVFDRQIILHRALAKRMPAENILQQRTVTGVVTDQSGQPLPGVTVVVTGTTQGTVTNSDGNFSLPIPDGAETLQFSFVGMRTQEVPIEGRTTFTVVMEEETIGLEEVVAVGYAMQKKETLTGSVSQISGEQIANRVSPNIVNTLQGTMPNLNITRTQEGGELGAALNINIRGYGSISGGSPLVIVDGVEQKLENVDPNTIKSISVLKDATATAIYGSRAAFGVINILTKRGKNTDGKVLISVNSNAAWNKPVSLPKMVNSLQFIETFNEAYKNAGQSSPITEEQIEKARQYLEDPSSLPSAAPGYLGDMDLYAMQWYTGYANNDWFDVLYKDWAFTQTHNINMQGGSEKFNFFVSGELYDQEGQFNFGNENFQRYNLLSNIEAHITDWLSIKFNNRYARQNLDKPFVHNGDIYHNISRTYPLEAVKDPNGNFGNNTILWLDDGGRDITSNDELVNSIHAIIEPVKNWKINAEINFRQNFNKASSHKKTVYRTEVDGETKRKEMFTYPNQFFRSLSRNYYNTNNIYSSYDLEFGKHMATFLVGFQNEKYKYTSLSGNIMDLITDEVPSISTGIGQYAVGDSEGHWATQGYFGRINYSFNDKYLLEIVGRYGGSSRFPEDNRFGVFPGVSLGYNIANEEFWSGKLAEKINLLKLRVSYGEVGNQDVANYLYIANMAINQNANWIINNTRPNYMSPPNIISSSISWETVRTTNLGFDAFLFDNKLSFTFDYYVRATVDMFGPAESLPSVLGTSAPRQNNADLETKGFETEIGWKDRIGKLHYNLRFSLSDNLTTITKYKNLSGILSDYYIGKELGEIWGFTSVGLYQTDEEADAGPDQSYFYPQWSAGDMQYADLNGDGKINRGANTLDDHGDISVIGNTNPRYAYGINLDLGWKNFDLKVFGQGIGKRDWVFQGSNQHENLFYGIVGQYWQSNVFEETLDYWRPDNMDAYLPKPYMNISHFRKNTQPQTRYTLSAAYFRLKNIQLGYTLPESLSSKIQMQRLRVYFTAENILTFDKIPDTFDPETLSASYSSGKAHVLPTTLSLGLNITLK